MMNKKTSVKSNSQNTVLVTNLMTNVIAGIIAHQFLSEKPSIKFEKQGIN